jgi:hypothetical protein
MGLKKKEKKINLVHGYRGPRVMVGTLEAGCIKNRNKEKRKQGHEGHPNAAYRTGCIA